MESMIEGSDSLSSDNAVENIDLSAIVNSEYRCFGIEANDLHGIRPGVHRVGNIGFKTVNPEMNNGKALVVLSAAREDLSAQVSIPLATTCDWIYLLHSTMKQTGGSGPAVEFVYADGQSSSVPIELDRHYSGDWNEASQFTDSACHIQVDNFGAPELCCNKQVTLYAVSLKNPYPDIPLSRIELKCDSNNPAAIWCVFAAALGRGENQLEFIEKESSCCVNINPDRSVGTIKALHGTNLAAPLTNKDINQDLKKLEIPIVRLHDAPLENGGLQLVDISRVFPIFSADHNNPDNYYFKQTDDYVSECLANGMKISYRLGESIERTRKNKYFIHPPKDFKKWAEICVNVIAHYNEGWADGFYHDIQYWPIWEEPDMTSLWTGPFEDYIKMYIITAKAIKSRFPHVKVGGPTLCRFKEIEATRFLEECRAQGAPVDFFAYNSYYKNPDDMLKNPVLARKLLDKYGFVNTEIQIAEWNYFPGSWLPELLVGNLIHRKWLASKKNGEDGSAFIGTVLSGWQDTPLDMANYYVGSSLTTWGLFDSLCRERNKTYYAFKAFNIISKYINRIVVDKIGGDNIRVLAGRKDNGDIGVLVSCFKGGARSVVLNFKDTLPELKRCRASIIDSVRNLERIEDVTVTEDSLTLEKPLGSAVFLIEITR
ncbi:MAG: hypothetical protein JXR78_11505 [Victivallales bacterium]|nr:hypothetical protein [Victivallales bacterium]